MLYDISEIILKRMWTSFASCKEGGGCLMIREYGSGAANRPLVCLVGCGWWWAISVPRGSR